MKLVIVLFLLFILIFGVQTTAQNSVTQYLDSIDNNLSPITINGINSLHTLNVSTQGTTLQLDELQLSEVYHTYVQIDLLEGENANTFGSTFYTVVFNLHPYSPTVPSVHEVQEADLLIGDQLNFAVNKEDLGEVVSLTKKTEGTLRFYPVLTLLSSNTVISQLTFSISIQVLRHNTNSDKVVEDIVDNAQMKFKTIAIPSIFDFSTTNFVSQKRSAFIFLPYSILPINIEGMNLTGYYIQLTLIFKSNRPLEESFEDFLSIESNDEFMFLDHESNDLGENIYYYTSYFLVSDIIELLFTHTGSARSVELIGIVIENDNVYVNQQKRDLSIPEKIGTLVFVVFVSYLASKSAILMERRRIIIKQQKYLSKVNAKK